MAPLNREAEEERTMYRNHFPARLLVLPVMLIALVTGLVLQPLAVAYADAPTPVSGTRMRVGPYTNVTIREAGGNTIITRDFTQVWSGGLSGTAQVQQTQI